jgi:hypothetical protein
VLIFTVNISSNKQTHPLTTFFASSTDSKRQFHAVIAVTVIIQQTSPFGNTTGSSLSTRPDSSTIVSANSSNLGIELRRKQLQSPFRVFAHFCGYENKG